MRCTQVRSHLSSAGAAASAREANAASSPSGSAPTRAPAAMRPRNSRRSGVMKVSGALSGRVDGLIYSRDGASQESDTCFLARAESWWYDGARRLELLVARRQQPDRGIPRKTASAEGRGLLRPRESSSHDE